MTSQQKVRVRENFTRGIFVSPLSKQPLSLIYIFQQICCDVWGELKERFIAAFLFLFLCFFGDGSQICFHPTDKQIWNGNIMSQKMKRE